MAYETFAEFAVANRGKRLKLADAWLAGRESIREHYGVAELETTRAHLDAAHEHADAMSAVAAKLTARAEQAEAALAQLRANWDCIPLDDLRQIANESQLASSLEAPAP